MWTFKLCDPASWLPLAAGDELTQPSHQLGSLQLFMHTLYDLYLFLIKVLHQKVMCDCSANLVHLRQPCLPGSYWQHKTRHAPEFAFRPRRFNLGWTNTFLQVRRQADPFRCSHSASGGTQQFTMELGVPRSIDGESRCDLSINL